MAPPGVTLPIGSQEEVPEEVTFTVPHLLSLKRNGGELTTGQITFLVSAICDGTMEDAQLGAFLMSVAIKGMTKLETAALTNAMKNSGTVFEWPSSWTVADKHSTGGVGDKVSLALAPALASNGLKVPMISGKGLGHTGGTLDKLESIPGFKICLTEEEMLSVLETVGCCIVGQTATVVPADKRMYAVRDVTATVSSIPLIVSSIISKKACESLHSLVLDVKFGHGSFMKSQFEAESLAESLVGAGDALGLATSALITRMDHPVGRKIGNALEVEEALQCLKGEGPQDLRELVVSLGAELLVSTGICTTLEEGKRKIAETLDNGSALRTFSKMMQAQGVTTEVSEKLCSPTYEGGSLPSSKHSTQLLASKSGTIVAMNALSIAEVCLGIGAGRITSSDSINYGVGIVLFKVVGEDVEEGAPWAEIRHDSPLEESLLKKANSFLTVDKHRAKKPAEPLVVRRICRTNTY